MKQTPQNHFEGFYNSFRMDISEIKQLCEDVEKMMLKRKFEAHGWKSIASNLTDSTERAILMLSSEQGEHEYGVVFPNLAHGSFLLTTVGLFDRYLCLVCIRSCDMVNGNCAGSISKTRLKNTLSGGVRKKLTFLEENVGLSLSDQLSVPLDLMLEVRHAFAHSAGVLDSSRARKLCALRNLAKEQNYGNSNLTRIKLEEFGANNHAIVIDQFFLFSVFKQMLETFAGILSGLESKLSSYAM